MEKFIVQGIATIPERATLLIQQAVTSADDRLYEVLAQEVRIVAHILSGTHWDTIDCTTLSDDTDADVEAQPVPPVSFSNRWQFYWERGQVLRNNTTCKTTLCDRGLKEITPWGSKPRAALNNLYGLACATLALDPMKTAEQKDYRARPMTAVQQEWNAWFRIVFDEPDPPITTGLVDLDGILPVVDPVEAQFRANGVRCRDWYDEVCRMVQPGVRQVASTRARTYMPHVLKLTIRALRDGYELAESVIQRKIILELPMLHMAATTRTKTPSARDQQILMERHVMSAIQAELERRLGRRQLYPVGVRHILPRCVGDMGFDETATWGSAFKSLGGCLRPRQEGGIEYTVTMARQQLLQRAWDQNLAATTDREAVLQSWREKHQALAEAAIARREETWRRTEEAKQLKKERTIRKKGVAMREQKARASTLPPLPTTAVKQSSPPLAPPQMQMNTDLYWCDTPNANVFGCDKSVASERNDNAFPVWQAHAPTGFTDADATDTALPSGAAASMMPSSGSELVGGLRSLLPTSATSSEDEEMTVAGRVDEMSGRRVEEGERGNEQGSSSTGSSSAGTLERLSSTSSQGGSADNAGRGQCASEYMTEHEYQRILAAPVPYHTWPEADDDTSASASTSSLNPLESPMTLVEAQRRKRKRTTRVRDAVNLVCKRMRKLTPVERRSAILTMVEVTEGSSSSVSSEQ